MTSEDVCGQYVDRLTESLSGYQWEPVVELAESLWECWENGNRLFLCGNGGSAANAVHLANDFLYGIDPESGRGLRVMALPANTSVLTCLANDTDYAEVFGRMLTAQAQSGDVLIVLSGSGNSPNVVYALETAAKLKMKSFAILGFSGGKCLDLVDHPIHFPVDDMQVSEDLQMVVGHMVMKWLKSKRKEANAASR